MSGSRDRCSVPHPWLSLYVQCRFSCIENPGPSRSNVWTPVGDGPWQVWGGGPITPPGPATVRTDRKDLNSSKQTRAFWTRRPRNTHVSKLAQDNALFDLSQISVVTENLEVYSMNIPSLERYLAKSQRAFHSSWCLGILRFASPRQNTFCRHCLVVPHSIFTLQVIMIPVQPPESSGS